MGTSRLHRWKEIEPEQMNPLTTRQFVVGTNTMLARLVLKKGAHVPLHNHMNEQISHVVEGKLEFLLEGKSVTVRAGEDSVYSAACAPRSDCAGGLSGAGHLQSAAAGLD